MKADALIDREHLAAQTFGDGALAQEVLRLFVSQCRRLLPGIVDPALGASTRADLAHTLKGSALGVGAVEVAAISAALEDEFRAQEQADARLLDRLTLATEATIAEIAGVV